MNFLLNAALLAIGLKAATCQKGMIQVSAVSSYRDVVNCWGCCKGGWSPPTANAPGLPRAPSGAVGIPRTPTGNPILFGNSAQHAGASASLSPEVFKRLSSSAFAGLLRFHRSDLGDRKLHVAKSENSQIAKCGFMLPFSSAVTISDLDRLLGEGVTLCGHACFNTTCSPESVLKGGA